MLVTVEEINDLYIVVNDGAFKYMKDSTFNEITNLNKGDELEIDAEDLEKKFWVLD